MRILWSSTWLSLRLIARLRVRIWIPRLAVSALAFKETINSTKRMGEELEFLLLIVGLLVMLARGCKLLKDLSLEGQLSKDFWIRQLLNQIKSTVDRIDMFLHNKFTKVIASESFKSFWLQLLWCTLINKMTMNHLKVKMKNITKHNSKAGRGTRLILMIGYEVVKWFQSMVAVEEKFLNQWLRSSRCKIKLAPLLIRSLALFHLWMIFMKKSSHSSVRFSVTWETSYLNSGRLIKAYSSNSASRSHTSSTEGWSGSWT